MTGELIVAAHSAAPSNVGLLRLAQDFGLSAATPALERALSDGTRGSDPGVWIERLAAIARAVCRVEIAGEGVATGFLVGPDLVLTSFHALSSVVTRQSPGEVALRFDYKRAADGTVVSEGVVFSLHDGDWLIDASPPAAIGEWAENPPHPEELDFVLLRLAGESTHPTRPASPPRGWIPLPHDPPRFDAGAPLFVVQHPVSAALSVAFNAKASAVINANGTRVQYRVNTVPGSSGAPVFDQEWRLVAVHQGVGRERRSTNQGVPVDAIRELLRSRGRRDVLDRWESPPWTPPAPGSPTD